MFIQTESTPNPLTLKFIPGVQVHPKGTAFYTNKTDASESPLASKLFDIAEVNAVFLSSDFITVTRKPEAEWEVIKPELLTTIMDHFLSGIPVIVEQSERIATPRQVAPDDADPEIVAQIKELIETRVRPAVAQDGGDIVYHDFKNGIVTLELHGACSGCPSSTATLKNGIENMLKHYIPEVIAVEAVA
jgi:Fe-S cluster biogenesis protein NfuA